MKHSSADEIVTDFLILIVADGSGATGNMEVAAAVYIGKPSGTAPVRFKGH